MRTRLAVDPPIMHYTVVSGGARHRAIWSRVPPRPGDALPKDISAQALYRQVIRLQAPKGCIEGLDVRQQHAKAKPRQQRCGRETQPLCSTRHHGDFQALFPIDPAAAAGDWLRSSVSDVQDSILRRRCRCPPPAKDSYPRDAYAALRRPGNRLSASGKGLSPAS